MNLLIGILLRSSLSGCFLFCCCLTHTVSSDIWVLCSDRFYLLYTVSSEILVPLVMSCMSFLSLWSLSTEDIGFGHRVGSLGGWGLWRMAIDDTPMTHEDTISSFVLSCIYSGRTRRRIGEGHSTTTSPFRRHNDCHNRIQISSKHHPAMKCDETVTVVTNSCTVC